ncbi:MAG TPA: biotin/lipoyl-containing protein [Rhizomicrobium sp.]|nr:biotin/lipoyl-containing protein [Rhizomicrobium sp.]
MSAKGDNNKGDKPQAKTDAKPGIDSAAIRELAELLKETGLTEIEIEHNGARLRVSRGGGVAMQAGAPAPVGPAAAPAASASGPPAGAVPSPMVGTVYLAPEPGKPPFIAVGKTVKEGDTLFILEAMKTMNAVTAPKGGTVQEICIQDGTPVEFGQTLCVIA